MDASVMALDTRAWLDEALGPRGERTKRAKLLLKILNCKNTEYIYVRFIGNGPKSRSLTHAEIIACAEALGVPNPLDDLPQVLQPGIAEYQFYGRIDDQNLKSHETIPLLPFLAESHPLYPDSRPMAWLVADDAMDELGYVKGTVACGVDIKDSGASLSDGDLVVVELTQHSRLGDSTSVIMRAVKLVNDEIELVPHSNKPGHASITTNEKEIQSGDEIKILTLVHVGKIPRK